MSDWNVHAVIDEPKPGLYNVHTHGLERNGLMNLMTIGKEPEILAYMLNSTADLMLKGDEFDPAITHYIDREDGSSILSFTILPPRDNYGEDNLYLDLNWHDPDLKLPKLKMFGEANR